MSDKFGFDKVQQSLKEAEREVMVMLSNQAANYFVKSFRDQGFDGKPWQEVQRRNSGTNPKTGKGYSAYLYPKTKGLQRRDSPILVGAGYKIRGGTLRRAVSAMNRTAEISGLKMRMIVDLPYAKYNNEGTDKLPKRQFIGQTQELSEMQRNSIDKIIKKVWKK